MIFCNYSRIFSDDNWVSLKTDVPSPHLCVTHYNNYLHVKIILIPLKMVHYECTCRFSPLAKLYSILAVRWASIVPLTLCNRNDLTVTMGQSGGSIRSTWAASNWAPWELRRLRAGVINTSGFPEELEGEREMRRGRGKGKGGRGKEGDEERERERERQRERWEANMLEGEGGREMERDRGKGRGSYTIC